MDCAVSEPDLPVGRHSGPEAHGQLSLAVRLSAPGSAQAASSALAYEAWGCVALVLYLGLDLKGWGFDPAILCQEPYKEARKLPVPDRRSVWDLTPPLLQSWNIVTQSQFTLFSSVTSCQQEAARTCLACLAPGPGLWPHGL